MRREQDAAGHRVLDEPPAVGSGTVDHHFVPLPPDLERPNEVAFVLELGDPLLHRRDALLNALDLLVQPPLFVQELDVHLRLRKKVLSCSYKISSRCSLSS
jgi:hypothetical protein